MEATLNVEFTREKQQALLIGSYKRAVALLHRSATQQQGKTILLQILNNPDLYEPSLRELRLSTLLSLAQLNKMQGQIKNALYYWHQSTKIQSNFNTWVKIAQSLQKIREQMLQQISNGYQLNQQIGLYEIQQQIEYSYKNSIKQSPSHWRPQLLTKLKQIYQRHGKELQVKDLEQTIKDNNIEEIFSEKIGKDPQQNTVQLSEKNAQIEQNLSLDQVKIPMYFLISEQANPQDNMNTWDYILSLCNFLMNPSVGLKKSSKKYDDLLTKFTKFNIFKTEIHLIMKNPVPSVISQKQEQKNQKDDENGAINNSMLAQQNEQKQINYEFQEEMDIQKKQQQNIKQTEIKRQSQQQSNQQKLYNLILDICREMSKQNNSSTQTKSKKSQIQAISSNNKVIFESLLEYFREVFISKSIDVGMLDSLKYIDPVQSPILKSIFNDQQNQQNLYSTISSVIQGVNRISAQKQREKEKQKQNKQGWTLPLVNQQDNAINTRERRSTLTPNVSLSTPGRQKLLEQNKHSDELTFKLKQQFFKWANKQKLGTYTNVVQLTRQLVQKLFQAYQKYNLIQFIEIQQSQTSSPSPTATWLKNTNKLLAQIICKLLQVTQLSFIEYKNENIKILAMILLKHLQQQYSMNPNNPKLIPIYNYVLQTCHNAIDLKIYKNSQMRNKNGSFQYSWDQINQILNYLYICVMLCSLPNSIDEQKIKMYTNKYQFFYQLKQNKQNQQLILRSLNSKSVIIDPPKFKQMIENRIRKSKLKQLSQQEFQESVLIASIDKLLKTDMKTSQTIQSVKSIMSISSGSILCYLKSFSKLVQILFNNLQSNNGFNTKFIQNALKVMQIPMLIQALHSKLTQDRKGQKQKQKQKVPQKNQSSQQNPVNQTKQKGVLQIASQNVATNKKSISKDSLKLEYKLKISTLYNLIKIYMLNQLDSHNSSLCFRIILYLLEQALNTMDLFHQSHRQSKKYYDVQLQMEVSEDSQSVHFENQQSICKIIILFDSLIKMRESNDVRKKFYHRILIRNIRYIYHNYNNHQGTPNQIRVQIYKILNDTFHNKNYKPKKIEDCLGYFLMISRQFASQFDKQQVEFQQKMKRVFNQCYLIFKEEFSKNYKFCDRFSRAMEYFVYYMRKKIKQKQVIKFFTANQIICNCCQGPFVRNEVNKQKFDKEVLFIVAKYLQNKKNQQKAIITNITNTSPNKQQSQTQLSQKTPNTTPTKEQKQQKLIQLEEEIERYYLKYFLLAVNTGKAWYQMLRFQISKVYAYFDALINSDFVQVAQAQTNLQVLPLDDNLELYKHKFKYAKMIGSFIVRNFTSQNYAEAKQYALYRINIANTLKIRQRKLNKKFSQMERVPQLMTFHINKYIQGIITIMLRKSEKQDQQFAIGNKYPQVSFLLYIQYKLPYLIYQCQNTHSIKNIQKAIMLTLEQGIELINQIRMNGQSDRMIDQANQVNQKLFQSRYKVKHLQKQLKVEIICCISQIILECLQYLQNITSKMNKRNLKEEMRKRLLKSNQIQEVKDVDEQKKCIEKLELLSKIHLIINQNDNLFEQWRTQNDGNQQKIVELDDNQSSKKIIFKDKYLFPDYLVSIQGIETILKKFMNILERIVKQNMSNRFKKQNYCRFIFTSNLWISKIHHRYGSRQTTLSYVKEIANLKNEDLINFYHHYQNQPTEQNLVLAEFYSRDIVFHYTKIQAVEHLLSVYSKPDTLQISIMLIRKLAKMYLQKIDIQTEKQKKQENKQTEQGKEKQKEKKPKDQKQKVKQGQKEKQKQKGKKGKKDGKDSKEKINKNSNKMERKIKWLYILFLRGFQIYMDALITHLNQKEQMIEQKFEKALLQFKNKIKREVQKDKKKSPNDALNGQKRYAARLVSDSQSFIAYYETRFNKKIRMKATKKKTQQSQIQALEPVAQKIENKQQKQIINIKKEIIEQQQSGEQQKQYVKVNEQDENQVQVSQEQIENENIMEEEDKKIMKQQSVEQNQDLGNIVNQCQQQQQQDPEQDDSDP